jgi:hypothetical protein
MSGSAMRMILTPRDANALSVRRTRLRRRPRFAERDHQLSQARREHADANERSDDPRGTRRPVSPNHQTKNESDDLFE